MFPRAPNQAAVTLSPLRAAASHSVITFAANLAVNDGQKFGQMSAKDVSVKEFLLLVVAVRIALHHTLSKGLFLSVI